MSITNHTSVVYFYTIQRYEHEDQEINLDTYLILFEECQQLFLSESS